MRSPEPCAWRRWADGLALLWACKVAALAITQGQYGDPGASGLSFAWYGLVVLYAVGSWIAGAPGARLGSMGRRVLAGGGVACAVCMLLAGLDPSVQAVARWYDWAVLGGCFWLGALYPRSRGTR